MDHDPSTVTLDDIACRKTTLPEGLELGERLGQGTNNTVYRAYRGDERLVLRAPRRKSDTQQRGSAAWELRHALRAAQLGVGPIVHAAWYARHATSEWPSGLYMVLERFDDDLETLLCEDREARERLDVAQLATGIQTCLATLARDRLFVFDLKLSNIVATTEEDGTVRVRLIDFGRDFCEWSGCPSDPTSSTPHIDMLTRRIEAGRDLLITPPCTTEALVSHVLFATMMVVFSCTTTRCLHETRRQHRMDAETRAAHHPAAAATRALLDGMQGNHVELVRELLRMDEVRGVLRHYHGRRSSGTGVTLKLARGEEC